jgi:hypothetical protein
MQNDPHQSLPQFWRLLKGAYNLNKPATLDTVESAEREFDRRFPGGLKWLWSITDGLHADDDNTTIYPASKVVEQTRFYHGHSSYPDEALVIGDNGAGNHFAMWAPRGVESTSEVVFDVVQFCWDAPDIRTAGRDLAWFLWARHCFYATLASEGKMMFFDNVGRSHLDLLGAPTAESLAVKSSSDAFMDALYAIASEGAPVRPAAGWSNEALRGAFGASS